MRAWAYKIPNQFIKAAEADTGAADQTKSGKYSKTHDAVLIKLSGDNTQEFKDPVQHAGAMQAVLHYFGGEPPAWLRDGLASYGQIAASSGGKGAKPTPNWVKRARNMISGSVSLEEWFKGPRDKENSGLELWAWHWFLIHGKAPKAGRKAYESYIATLRKTGDVAAAQKHWEGVDFAALHAAFKKFGEKWK